MTVFEPDAPYAELRGRRSCRIRRGIVKHHHLDVLLHECSWQRVT